MIDVARLDRDSAERLAAALLAFSADQPWENWTADHLLSERPRKWELSLVALSDGEPAGYAILSQPEPNRHHLHRIAVPPALRSQGVGNELMRAAMEQAEFEAASLTLKVHVTNLGAIRFYERLGFTAVNTTDEQLLMAGPKPE